MRPPTPRSTLPDTLVPYATLFRSRRPSVRAAAAVRAGVRRARRGDRGHAAADPRLACAPGHAGGLRPGRRRRRLAGSAVCHARPARPGARAGPADGAGGRHAPGLPQPFADRKSVVSGKSVSVRVDLGGRRIIKNKYHLISAMNYLYQHTNTAMKYHKHREREKYI